MMVLRGSMRNHVAVAATAFSRKVHHHSGPSGPAGENEFFSLRGLILTRKTRLRDAAARPQLIIFKFLTD